MKKKLLWGVAVSLLSFTIACEEVNEVKPEPIPVAGNAKSAKGQGLQKYTIRAGEHHSTLTYESAELESLQFKALFDSSAIYQNTEAINQAEINKLYGLSDCNSYHHTNSARFGWRWFDNKLEIWAYIYENGQPKSSFVDTVALNQFYQYTIRFEKNKYVFEVNNKVIELPRLCEEKALGYKLFPYFGGEEAAPKDISIWIEEVQD